MSLIEVVIAIVLIGVLVSALTSALVTATVTSTSHRDLVTADAVLRSYAEAVNTAAHQACYPGGASSFTAGYTPPAGFTVASSLGNTVTCPSPTSLALDDLTVTLPSGVQKSMSIEVRSA